MSRLKDRDRTLLFLWYVRQLAVTDIAKSIHTSRRHCFRLRAAAIREIVELGEPSSRLLSARPRTHSKQR